MADRIKGITVEIGGDTTKLSDTLKNVNKFIRETQKQLRDVNKLLKLDSGNAEGHRRQITGGDTSLSTHATASIAAVGAASLAAFKEVDEGAHIVTQKTGASGKALKEMQDAANDIATSIPTDFATAGSAIGEVNTRFGLTGEKLKELSQQFVEFASLNDTDVSTSIDNVSSILNAFGMDASQAGGMLDVLKCVAGRLIIRLLIPSYRGCRIADADGYATVGRRLPVCVYRRSPHTQRRRKVVAPPPQTLRRPQASAEGVLHGLRATGAPAPGRVYTPRRTKSKAPRFFLYPRMTGERTSSQTPA